MPVDAVRLAERLMAVDGVAAVVLGGSRARGVATADSDLDLGLYYDPAAPPGHAALDALATELDDRHQPGMVTRFGEWGPWINGGAWLTIGGERVDWLFKDLARIRRVVHDCRAGHLEIAYQLGHPHAFVSAIYLGELDLCVPLADPHGVVAELKRLVRPYPPLLRRALVERCSYEAEFSLAAAKKGVARGDVAYVVGHLYRAVASLAQVLFARDERYCTNEKGALAELAGLGPPCPEVAATATRVLAAVGSTPGALGGSVAAIAALAAVVRASVSSP